MSRLKRICKLQISVFCFYSHFTQHSNFLGIVFVLNSSKKGISLIKELLLMARKESGFAMDEYIIADQRKSYITICTVRLIQEKTQDAAWVKPGTSFTFTNDFI